MELTMVSGGRLMAKEESFPGIGIAQADRGARNRITDRKRGDNFRERAEIGVAYRQMMRIIKEIENDN